MDTTSKAPDTPVGKKTPAEPPSSPGAASRTVLGPDGEAARVAKGAAGFLDEAGERGRELGERAGEAWSGVASTVDGFVTREPMRGALAALGVGFVIGLILGVTIARD